MKTTNKIAAAGLSATLLIGLAMPAASAASKANTSAVAVQKVASEKPFSIDWAKIAQQAEAAGATDIAEIARTQETLEKLRASGVSISEPAGLFGAGKKAVLWTLEHSAHLFPAKAQKYINKITDVVRKVELSAENELIVAFQTAGIPYDVDKDAAWVIMNVIL